MVVVVAQHASTRLRKRSQLSWEAPSPPPAPTFFNPKKGRAGYQSLLVCQCGDTPDRGWNLQPPSPPA